MADLKEPYLVKMDHLITVRPQGEILRLLEQLAFEARKADRT